MRPLKPILLALGLLACVPAGRAADVTAQLDSLISEGNRAYVEGRMSEIMDIVHEARALYDNLPADDKFSSRDNYDASINKLLGDYFYLKGCAGDATAFAYAESSFKRARTGLSDRISTGALVDLELAQLYYRREMYAQALECLDNALDYYDTSGIYEPGDTEWNALEMQRAITMARLGRHDEARRLADETVNSFKDRKSLDYARARRMQAKILGLAGADRKTMLKAYSDYFKTQRAYALENFAGMDSRQREEYWMMLRPFVTDAYAIEDADAEFLYDLTLFAKGLLLQLETGAAGASPSRTQLKKLEYTWRDIRSKLKPGEAAVEFVQYTPFEGKRQEMAALVLRHGDKPRWVRQPSPLLIDERFGRAIDNGERTGKDRVYRDTILPGYIWSEGLMQALDKCHTVFFAPDGCYHNIAMEYIVPEGGPEARRLTSTRRLMDRGEESAKLSASDPMLLFGDIDYYQNPAPEQAVDNDYLAYRNFLNYEFPLLSEETDETRVITRMRANRDDVRQRSIFATEGAFRRLVPHFKSILVSTHGITLSTNTHLDYESDLKAAVEDGTLSSTVIGMTGVNACVQDENYLASLYYDGLVSARELSSLDLSECRLFTMSACQTGLGEVTADGVYGLQRGLKNAGAGAMLLSLWSVHSDATARLMTAFYSRLARGEAFHAAFRGAREDLKNGTVTDEQMGLVESDYEYSFNPATLAGQAKPLRKVPYYNSPQFTDAFILIDAID